MRDNSEQRSVQSDFTPAPRMLKRISYRLLEWLVVLIGLAIFVYVMLPSMAGPGGGPMSPRAACLSNLREIGIGLGMYAEKNDNAMPPALSAITTIYGEQLDLTCPAAGKPVYIYLPTPTMISSSRLIYVYEPPGMHDEEGAAALFSDGHVEWCTPEELQQHLDYRRTVLAGATSRPAEDS